MTTEAVVTQIIAIIANMPNFSEEGVYETMRVADIPFSVANRAYQFTQIAWGRSFIEGMGVKVSQDYMCFDANGNVLESGLLLDEPYVVAARHLLIKFMQSQAYTNMLIASADVSIVGRAVRRNEQPEDLIVGPAVVFLEPPTEQGMRKAERLCMQGLEKLKPEASASKNPSKLWWQFWRK